LRSELPVRLAHRILDLDQVPLMRDMPSVKLVKGIYINSFVDIARYSPILTAQDEDYFSKFLTKKYEAHSNVLIQMARGAYELQQDMQSAHMHLPLNSTEGTTLAAEFSQLNECHAFLDRFYMSCIGIRVLAGQYLALQQPPIPNYIGMICLKTSPYFITKAVARDATQMCLKKYRESPEVEINGRCDLNFCYIPSYLQYMLLELIKNAMRATVE
jgi:pyruvate dehydrogenase kinase 2/3/4